MSSKTHRDEKNFNQAALDYHKAEPKGKIEVIRLISQPEREGLYYR